MIRQLLVCIVLVFLAGPVLAADKVTTTNDPNHPGWVATGKYREPVQVKWKDSETECLPCRSLVGQYNTVMQEIMEYRFWTAYFEWSDRMGDKAEVQRLRRYGTSNGEARVDAFSMALGEILTSGQLWQERIDKMKPSLKVAEAKAQKLRQMIADCEKQCKSKVTKTTGIKLGGLPLIAGVDPKSLPDLEEHKLDFDWKGPYADGCFKCAKLAKRLNELPGLAQERQVKRASLLRGKAAGTKILFVEEEVAGLSSDLKAIKENFAATLALYNDCIKTCKTKTACYQPERSYENISIGPNETYGSGAQVKETAKNLMGGGAGLGSLGGGGTFGGGLGGKKPKGSTFSESKTRSAPDKKPETVADPTRGSFTKVSASDVDMDLRANLTGDGLLVSLKLDDVPGDGTFHALWLEDNEGRVIRPTRYLPFSMYRDWWLHVWWTYDRWVDGQHVEHKEGGWSESGREERDGMLAFYGGEKGVQNAIWHQQGFDTPVNGIQHLGAVFPVTAADLSGPCPLRLITHVALPDEDPVITQPFVNDLSLAVDTAGIALEDEPLAIRQTFKF